MLEIFLLGQFNIKIDGRRVEIPSRPAQSLLAYLALTAGIAHRREKLAGQLWPDITDMDARRNLRQALWQIRKVLESQIPLEADDINIRFIAGSNTWVDALVLTQKLSPEPPTEDLIRITQTYGGELLPGFFEDWVVVDRERLQAVFESRIKLLLKRLVEAGEWENVLEWGERWIALTPGAEPAYRAVMIAYTSQGDLSGLGHTYERLVEVLERDLGVEPSEETSALYQQLFQKRTISRLKGSPLPNTTLPSEKPVHLQTNERPDQIEVGQDAGEREENTLEISSEESPYKGLQSFDEADQPLFFGREEITRRLLKRLGLVEKSANQPLNILFIVGASGSGKSSLVKAGLIPEIRHLPGWEVANLTPSTHPLESLATTLIKEEESVRAAAGLADDMAKEPRGLRLFLQRKSAPLFLVVDQLEEIFTLCRAEQERQAFIDNILAAAEGEDAKIILTLRADFYAHCAHLEGLRDSLAAHQEYIGPMNAAELRRAIEEPTRVCGYTFDSGLVDLILRDVGGEPGSLPLLSHALLETWKRHKGRRLTLAGYADAGGVHGAIAHTAQGVYNQLPPDEQRIARDIFLRLTELGEGAGPDGLPIPDTRRRIRNDELVRRTENRDCVEGVLGLLIEARLITVDQDTVEVAHEALIREWPALRGWLTEDRESLRFHRRLTEASQSWDAFEREPGELYRGARLAQAVEWAAIHPADLNDLEKEFLEASHIAVTQEAAEREAAREREITAAQRFAESEAHRAQEHARSAQRFRWLAAGLALLFLFAVMLASFYLEQRNQAADQAKLAKSRELAASSVSNLGIDPERSILLSLIALQTADTQEAETALHQSVQASRVIKVIRTQNPLAIRMVVSPDGQKLAATSISQSGNFVTQVWGLGDGKQILILPGGLAADFWPDDRWLATVGAGRGGKEVITIRDAQTGQPISVLQRDKLFPEESINGNFSPDWKLVAESFKDGTTTVSRLDNGEVVLRLGKTGEPPGGVLQFSPDGKRLLGMVNNTVQIWDISTGNVIATLPSAGVGVDAAAFSPKKDQVALGIGSLVKLVDASTGQVLQTLSGHIGFVQGIKYNATGDKIATVGADSQVILWDADTGQLLLKLAGHTGAVESLGFIPGSGDLATASLDGTVRVWDISPGSGGEGPSIYDPYQKWFTDIAFSPDGKRLAVSGGSSAGDVFDAATGQRLLSLPGNNGTWQGSVAFSPDGTQLAITSGENQASLWTIGGGSNPLTLSGHKSWIGHLAFSPDGKTIATIGFDGKAKLWDTISGKEILNLNAFDEKLDTSQILGVSFSPDGKHLVTAGGKTPKIWDIPSGKELLALPVQDENVYTAAFSPDGNTLAIGLALGAGASTWDLRTEKKLAQFNGHQGSVQAIVFSMDSKRVISGSVDGTIKIWDAASGEEVITLTRQTSQITGLALSSDGKRLAASASDGTASVYLLQTEDLIQYALKRLIRWFTPDECLKYLHSNTCPPSPWKA